MNRLRRSLAALLALTLVVLSPGLESYRAFAAVIDVAVDGGPAANPAILVPNAGIATPGANTGASGSASLGPANRFNGRFRSRVGSGLPPRIHEGRVGEESAVGVAVPSLDPSEVAEVQRTAELSAGNGATPTESSSSADKAFSLLQKLGLRKVRGMMTP